MNPRSTLDHGLAHKDTRSTWTVYARVFVVAKLQCSLGNKHFFIKTNSTFTVLMLLRAVVIRSN